MKCLVIEPNNNIVVKELSCDKIKDKDSFYFNSICDAYADKTGVENKLATEICKKLDIIGLDDTIHGSMIICGFSDSEDEPTDVPQTMIEELFNHFRPELQVSDGDLLICDHHVVSGKCEFCGIDI